MKLFTKILICAILAAVLVAPSFAASKAPTEGLVVYYSFDDAGTEVKDLKGNNTYTGVDSSRFVDGVSGKALSFAGDSASVLRLSSVIEGDPAWTKVDELTIPNPSRSFTVSAWIKSTFSHVDAEGKVVNDDGAVFCWGSFANATGVWGLVQGGSANVALANFDANDGLNSQYGWAWNYDTNRYGDDAISVNDDKWHNIVFVYDNSAETAFVYIDGKLYHKDPVSEMVIDPCDNYIYIGGRGGDSFFRGSLDELRIYNRAVTADEAAALANLGAANTSDYTAIAVLAVAVCGAVLVIRKKH